MDFGNALIKRGCIFHSWFENIKHGKFFVIIGEDENNYAGYFFINSNINQNISKKPELFEMQMPIKKSVYSSFLTHDSFIACHKISLISKNTLSEQIRRGLAKYKDRLTNEDEELLLDALRSSDLYSEKQKKRYFY
jgi:hypothetical protein